MLLAAKSIRFFRRHTERLYRYSKESAVYSYYLFLYSAVAGVLLLAGVIYFSQPPTALIGFVIDIFMKSPYLMLSFVLLSVIAYKAEVMSWLARLDPHRDHPVGDPIFGLVLFIVSSVGMTVIFGEFGGMPDLGSDTGIDLALNFILIVAIYSLIMFSISASVNGLSRFLSGLLTGLLYLHRIREIPTILLRWYRANLHRIRATVDIYRTLTLYADERDESTLVAAIRVFLLGVGQIEPVDHRPIEDLTDNPDIE